MNVLKLQVPVEEMQPLRTVHIHRRTKHLLRKDSIGPKSVAYIAKWDTVSWKWRGVLIMIHVAYHHKIRS